MCGNKNALQERVQNMKQVRERSTFLFAAVEKLLSHTLLVLLFSSGKTLNSLLLQKVE